MASLSDPLQDEMIKMGMMEELGKGRVENLPMEDRRRGEPRGFQPRQQVRHPGKASALTGSSSATSAWHGAISSGVFDDDDAEAVKGLDDLGGGRLYAARADHSRHHIGNFMPGMEKNGQAAQQYQRMGLDLPPRASLTFRKKHASPLNGAQLSDAPIISFASKQNSSSVPPLQSITNQNAPRRSPRLAAQKSNSNKKRKAKAAKTSEFEQPAVPSRHQLGNFPFKPRTAASKPQAQDLEQEAQLQRENPKPSTSTEELQVQSQSPSTSRAVPNQITGPPGFNYPKNTVYYSKVQHSRGNNQPVEGFVYLTSASGQSMGNFVLVTGNKHHEHCALSLWHNFLTNNNALIVEFKVGNKETVQYNLLFQEKSNLLDFLATVNRLRNTKLTDEQRSAVSSTMAQVPYNAALPQVLTHQSLPTCQQATAMLEKPDGNMRVAATCKRPVPVVRLPPTPERPVSTVQSPEVPKKTASASRDLSALAQHVVSPTLPSQDETGNGAYLQVTTSEAFEDIAAGGVEGPNTPEADMLKDVKPKTLQVEQRRPATTPDKAKVAEETQISKKSHTVALVETLAVGSLADESSDLLIDLGSPAKVSPSNISEVSSSRVSTLEIAASAGVKTADRPLECQQATTAASIPESRSASELLATLDPFHFSTSPSQPTHDDALAFEDEKGAAEMKRQLVLFLKMMIEADDSDGSGDLAGKSPEHSKPPKGYICNRCHLGGHLLEDCPTNLDPSFDIAAPLDYLCHLCNAQGAHWITLCPLNKFKTSLTMQRKRAERVAVFSAKVKANTVKWFRTMVKEGQITSNLSHSDREKVFTNFLAEPVKLPVGNLPQQQPTIIQFTGSNTTTQQQQEETKCAELLFSQRRIEYSKEEIMALQKFAVQAPSHLDTLKFLPRLKQPPSPAKTPTEQIRNAYSTKWPASPARQVSMPDLDQDASVPTGNLSSGMEIPDFLLAELTTTPKQMFSGTQTSIALGKTVPEKDELMSAQANPATAVVSTQVKQTTTAHKPAYKGLTNSRWAASSTPGITKAAAFTGPEFEKIPRSSALHDLVELRCGAKSEDSTASLAAGFAKMTLKP